MLAGMAVPTWAVSHIRFCTPPDSSVLLTMALHAAALLAGGRLRQLLGAGQLATHLPSVLSCSAGQATADADERTASAQNCSSSGRSFASSTLHQPLPPSFHVGLYNLKDNPGARKQVGSRPSCIIPSIAVFIIITSSPSSSQQKIRVGRGDGARRGNYCGRGMKGLKARGKADSWFEQPAFGRTTSTGAHHLIQGEHTSYTMADSWGCSSSPLYVSAQGRISHCVGCSLHSTCATDHC
jgi:hypothetical protein